MARGSLSDIGMYQGVATGKIERQLNAARLAVAACEKIETALYQEMVIDVYRLIKNIIQSFSNAVSVVVHLATAAGDATKTAAVAATGVGAVVGGAKTAWSIGKLAKSVAKTIKKIAKFTRRIGHLYNMKAKWERAIKKTDEARNRMHDIEQSLLAAMIEEGSFSNKILACVRRVRDHRKRVQYFYNMLVDDGLIADADIISDRCASHDKDKTTPFNLARQALRMIDKSGEDPYAEYIDMMKCVVEDHVHSNEHHPEYWSGDSTGKFNQDATRMPFKFIGEMCADWAAMSEEMGTSLMGWVDKMVNKKWVFTKEQTAFIRKCCSHLEPYTKGKKRDYGYLYYSPCAKKVSSNDGPKEESVNMQGNVLIESPVPRDEILGAIHVLLNLIGEDGGIDNIKDSDDKLERAERVAADEVEEPEEQILYSDDGVADTVETEDGMAGIMDSMNVPETVREVAPQILSNIVAQDDGSFRSVDGSIRIDDRFALKEMIGATLNAISKVMSAGGHANVSIGEDLRAKVTARDRFGHRREVSVNPVLGTGDIR